MTSLLTASDAVLQEWAAHNGVPVPHKEGRVNNSLLYKGGEEDTPTNILQVGIGLPPAPFELLALTPPIALAPHASSLP